MYVSIQMETPFIYSVLTGERLCQTQMQISRDIPEYDNTPRIMKTGTSFFFFFKHVMGNNGSLGDYCFC